MTHLLGCRSRRPILLSDRRGFESVVVMYSYLRSRATQVKTLSLNESRAKIGLMMATVNEAVWMAQ